MVTLGTLSWKVQVERAGEVKEKVKEVEEKVRDTKEAMEGADEMSGNFSDKLEVLSGVQDLVGRGLDKVNAKAGFFGTALSFVIGTVGTLIGTLGGLAGLMSGAVLAAFVALLALSPDFRKGFIEGISDGLKDLWNAAKTTVEVITGAVNTLAGVVGPVLSPILNVLGDVNEKFSILENLGYALGKALVYLLGGLVVIKAFVALVSVVSTVIGVLSTVVSVVGTVIAVLNPLTLIILGVVAVLGTLYVAWRDNWFGIRDIVGGVVDWMTKKIQNFVNWVLTIPSKIRNAFSGIGQSISSSIPDVSGGFNIGNVGLPSLDTGGVVERSGTAVIHKGEAIIPADVARNTGMTGGGGGGGGPTKVEIDIGGVDIGDQTMDLSKMNRTDIRALAQEIASVLGDEVRNVIS